NHGSTPLAVRLSRRGPLVEPSPGDVRGSPGPVDRGPFVTDRLSRATAEPGRVEGEAPSLGSSMTPLVDRSEARNRAPGERGGHGARRETRARRVGAAGEDDRHLGPQGDPGELGAA